MRSAIVGGIGTDRWNADAHKALAETYGISATLSASLENHAMAIGAVYLMWTLERGLRPIVEGIGTVKKSAQPVPTLEKARDAVTTLRHLYVELNEMCEKFSTIASNNRMCRLLVASKIKSVREYTERFLDLADAIELSLDPDLDRKFFDKAIGELGRGETHSLESIF